MNFFFHLNFVLIFEINDFVQKCKCKPKIKAFQISQGYYSVCGRNVFIRILNDKYYMVRVGKYKELVSLLKFHLTRTTTFN